MSAATHTAGAPTVVLVHGAFAASSSWNGVIKRLQAQGVHVTAAPNPLRGVAADSAYVASMVNQIDGPVLLVGRSYGGAVITNAATRAKNVVGLVHVARNGGAACRGSPAGVRRRDRVAQLAAAAHRRPARPPGAGQLLDLHLHQLAAQVGGGPSCSTRPGGGSSTASTPATCTW